MCNRNRAPVRAGSILPTGPEVQSTKDQPDGPLVLHIFTGADAAFSLYEDDGVSPGYLQGISVTVYLFGR